MELKELEMKNKLSADKMDRAKNNDIKILSRKLESIIQNMVKYSRYLRLDPASLKPEDVTSKTICQVQAIKDLKEMQLQAMTTRIFNRYGVEESNFGKEYRDMVILTSASLLMYTGSVIATEYQTSLPGLLEMIKGDAPDTDAIVDDFSQAVENYIGKVALYQIKNPIVEKDEKGEDVIRVDRMHTSHEAAGIDKEGFNLNALSVAVESSVSSCFIDKINAGVIYITDDIVGIDAMMDYSDIDIFAQAVQAEEGVVAE